MKITTGQLRNLIQEVITEVEEEHDYGTIEEPKAVKKMSGGVPVNTSGVETTARVVNSSLDAAVKELQRGRKEAESYNLKHIVSAVDRAIESVNSIRKMSIWPK